MNTWDNIIDVNPGTAAYRKSRSSYHINQIQDNKLTQEYNVSNKIDVKVHEVRTTKGYTRISITKDRI